jgi:hypothetical protein
MEAEYHSGHHRGTGWPLSDGGRRNRARPAFQPAGHLEHGETLFAAIRETRGKPAGRWNYNTWWAFTWWTSRAATLPGCVLPLPRGGVQHHPAEKLDAGIVSAHWLTPMIAARLSQHRSPVVMQCLDDYRLGQRLPGLIHHQP